MTSIAAELYTTPNSRTIVYALFGSHRVYLGYEDQAGVIDKVMRLPDHVGVEYETEWSPSILDEWTGTDVEVADYGSVSYESYGESKHGVPAYRKRRGIVRDHDGNDIDTIECLIRTEHESNDKALQEREAWDELQLRESFRSEAIDHEWAQRFEHRGPDAGAGHRDVLTQQRRTRSDREFGGLIRRSANVLGEKADRSQRRFFAAMSDRDRFRALVDAFGQDPDSDIIRAWKDSMISVERADGQTFLRARTYAELNSLLAAKADREGLDVRQAA